MPSLAGQIPRNQRPYTEAIPNQIQKMLPVPGTFNPIHRLNGPGKSAAIKCAALGAPVTDGTRVSRQLQRKQRKNEQDRLRKRSSKYRARRQTLVKQKFQMYFQRAETQIQADYSKGMSNPPYLIPRRPENILTVKRRK